MAQLRSDCSVTNIATPLDPGYVQLSGWDPINVGIDDSAPPPSPPATVTGVAGNFAGDVLDGLWNITVGAVHGIWQLASSTVPSAESAALNELKQYIDYEASLWQATENNPAAVAAFFSTLTSQVLAALQNTPWLLGAQSGQQIRAAVQGWEENFFNDWETGHWQAAEQDLVTPTTELAGSVALPVVAESLAPGVLARLPEAADAFKSATAKMIAEVSERLAPVVERVTSVLDGIKALDAVPAGFQFTIRQLENLAGLSKQQVKGLIDFCKPSGNPTGRGLIITLRSRAAQALDYIKAGVAAMKPEAIKIKTINWFDRYLGYTRADIGKVMVRFRLPELTDYETALREQGIREGTDEWAGAIANYNKRAAEIKDGLLQKLLDWNNAGTVRLRT